MFQKISVNASKNVIWFRTLGNIYNQLKNLKNKLSKSDFSKLDPQKN